MALSKQDYIKQGQEMAQKFIKAGKVVPDRGAIPLNDLDGNVLNMSMNGSWQAMAWKQGFTETMDYHVNLKNNPNKGQDKLQAVAHHLEKLFIELGKASASGNTTRADRILHKTLKISKKWGI